MQDAMAGNAEPCQSHPPCSRTALAGEVQVGAIRFGVVDPEAAKVIVNPGCAIELATALRDDESSQRRNAVQVCDVALWDDVPLGSPYERIGLLVLPQSLPARVCEPNQAQ